MTKYFVIPFARDGDKTAIPDTVQPGGEISYPEGWTADYEAEQGVDPNAKDVDRQKENQFKFDISEAMKEVQERGILPYRADVDYPIDAVVLASDSSQYIAVAANGPATSVVDPVGNPGTWANDILTVTDIGVTVQAFDATLEPGATNTSRKNVIINGSKVIDQRVFGSGQPAAGVYGVDRWKGDVAGTRLEQIVENTRTINEAYVISWVGGTGQADVDGVTGLDSGDSFTLNTSGNYSVIVPTDATDIQVERGSVDTDFEYQSIGDTLAQCQRYFWRITAGGSDLRVTTGQRHNENGSAIFTIPLPAEMRATPSISVSSASDIGFSTAVFATSFSFVSLSNTTGTGKSNIAISMTAAGNSFGTGEATVLILNSGFIQADAEL